MVMRIFMTFSEELGIRAFGLSGARKAFPCLKPAKLMQISDLDWVRLTFWLRLFSQIKRSLEVGVKLKLFN
jgi:hypothetical protein